MGDAVIGDRDGGDTQVCAGARAFERGSSQHIGRVLVLGLGKSGKSAARYCAALLGTRVSSLYIACGQRNADSEAFAASIASEGVEYAFGDDALARFDVNCKEFDLCIASPGIPYWHELYERGLAISEELLSEVEFAWRESAPDSTWVAITGTNGKTTTTACCAHILRRCGFAARAVGNIGDVCLDAVAAGDTSVYVAELSSYQLYSTHAFAPDVAVLLNITPDHVHWHKTFEAYRDAKFKVLDNMQMASRTSSQMASSVRRVAIMDATNDVVRAKVRSIKQLSDQERGFDYVPMGTVDGLHGDMRARCGARNAAFLDEGDALCVAYDGVEHVLAKACELLIEGQHNASNALAAASVAVVLGASDEDVSSALRTFAPLEHRIEPCGSVSGVACYNDSKATNVDATVKALKAFPGKRLLVLLGGDDKGTQLDDLVDAVYECASVAVCFGQAGPRFARELMADERFSGNACKVEQASHLQDALDCALAEASEGDVVLLSPACASFDEFKSFEHRGTVFKQLVSERAQACGEAGQE